MIWKYKIRIQIVTILSPSIRQVLLQEITKHKFSQKDLLTHIYQLNTFAQSFSHIIIRYNKHCLKIKLKRSTHNLNLWFVCKYGHKHE